MTDLDSLDNDLLLQNNAENVPESLKRESISLSKIIKAGVILNSIIQFFFFITFFFTPYLSIFPVILSLIINIIGYVLLYKLGENLSLFGKTGKIKDLESAIEYEFNYWMYFGILCALGALIILLVFIFGGMSAFYF